jgi:NAD(P)-dependent dehydrogenase (short-subunit alcohol dehydrogenase family)
VISGSARGLGKAIALRHGALGANVVVNFASSREAADVTVAEIERLGAKAIAVQADMSEVADIERLFAEAHEHFGMAPRYAVQVLAQELAVRGVTVNTILPTAIEGAGVFTDADAAQYLASDGGLGQRAESAGQRRRAPVTTWRAGTLTPREGR